MDHPSRQWINKNGKTGKCLECGCVHEVPQATRFQTQHGEVYRLTGLRRTFRGYRVRDVP